MIYTENVTPTGLAAKLAEYIADPSTIRVNVKAHFGRAPSVEQCANLRQAAENRRRPLHHLNGDKFRNHCQRHDGPYEVDINGIDQCVTCANERRRADMERELAHLRNLQAIRAAKEAERNRLEQEKIAETLNGLREAEETESAEIIRRAAEAFGISQQMLLGERRRLYIVDARTAVVRCLRNRGWSYPRIARRLNRDHSSIINLDHTYDVRIKRNPLIALVVDRLA